MGFEGFQIAAKALGSRNSSAAIPKGLGMDELDASVVRQAMAIMGRIGGSVRSERKAAASRANGCKGGRPKKQTPAQQQPALTTSSAPQGADAA